MPSTQSIRNGRDAGALNGGASPQAYLDIHLEGGTPTRRRLAESHLVIGRVPGVQLQLEHHTVSRRHAEMFRDPFGRWWIRDLGSTNGTTIGSEPVQERVLSPGDRIALGDYTLLFGVEGDAGVPESTDLPPYDDDNPTVLRKLVDLEPPRIAANHLRTLLKFSRRLLDLEDPGARLDELCELIIGADFCADVAVVIRVKGNRFAERSRPHRPLRMGQPRIGARPYISRRVLDMLHETRQPVLATNAVDHRRDLAVEITSGGAELWIIACPFYVDRGRDVMDVLYAQVPRGCATAEWLSLFALAGEVYQQSEAAWGARRHEQAHAAIERELCTARQIQRGLLPRRLVAPGLDVALGFDPCKWIGGDYVDVVHLPDGRVLFAVADVCGKGLQAALVGASLHTMVRATSDNSPTLSELVERVNRHLCGWLPSHSFVTMVAVMIDPANGALQCINAGHPPVMVVDRCGELRCLQDAQNPALGIAPVTMSVESDRMLPGDVLTMYTDGLTELRNAQREMLGQDRLGAELLDICAAHRTAGAVAEALTAFLEGFRGDDLPEDDRTFLVACRK